MELSGSTRFTCLTGLTLRNFTMTDIRCHADGRKTCPVPLRSMGTTVHCVGTRTSHCGVSRGGVNITNRSTKNCLTTVYTLSGSGALSIKGCLSYSDRMRTYYTFCPPASISAFPCRSPLASTTDVRSLVLKVGVTLGGRGTVGYYPISCMAPSTPPFVVFRKASSSAIPFSRDTRLRSLLRGGNYSIALITVGKTRRTSVFFTRRGL